MKTKLEKNHVVPEFGDTLCIRHRDGGWAFSGDYFHSIQGDVVTASQHFSSGATRFTHYDKSEFRVLRGTQLFHIATEGDGSLQ
jgi:hypothetical protein